MKTADMYYLSFWGPQSGHGLTAFSASGSSKVAIKVSTRGVVSPEDRSHSRTGYFLDIEGDTLVHQHHYHLEMLVTTQDHRDGE